ncbi:GntR family transcriptional regulator [Streptomyces sp. M10(2022)]
MRAGRLKPGEQLPSHRELQERFDIANMTARSALRVLRDEGLIYTVQGAAATLPTQSTPSSPQPPSRARSPPRATRGPGLTQAAPRRRAADHRGTRAGP